jgi:hypothetical protein
MPQEILVSLYGAIFPSFSRINVLANEVVFSPVTAIDLTWHVPKSVYARSVAMEKSLASSSYCCYACV